MPVGIGGAVHHAAGVGQRVGGGQIVTGRAVQLLFPPAQQPGAGEGADQIDHHGDGHGFGHPIIVAGVLLGHIIQLHDADDAEDGGVLDVDDEVVADLGNDVAQGLGEDDAQHGLKMGHADGLGALRLADVDGQNAAADCFRHIRAGVDGYNKESRRPLPHVDVQILHGAVIDEHGLHHHGRAAKNFHIDVEDQAHQPQKGPLEPGVLSGGGDGLDDAHQKADETAHQRAHQRDEHGLARTHQNGVAVVRQQIAHSAPEVGR